MPSKAVASIRLDPSQRAQIRSMARLLDLTESEVVRRALDRGLQFLVQGRAEDEVLQERLAALRSGRGRFLTEETFRKRNAPGG